MLKDLLLGPQVIKTQAKVQRCNATVTFEAEGKPFIPVVVNDEDLHTHFRKVAGDMLGAKNVIERNLLMGSEDFSFYQEVVPGYFYYLGMYNQAPLERGHSPFYTLNEDVLPYGAALHASLATTYLLRNVHPQPSSTSPTHDEL